MINAIVLIVPCYNEAERLDVADYELYLRENDSISFIFVDDGSQDGTFDLLELIKGIFPENVKLIRFPKNRGKAEAVRQGILKAVEMGFGMIGYWDADLATPLCEVKRMNDKMSDNISIVLGSRVKLLGHDIQRKAMRHYFGRIFATLASIALDLAVYDTQCGAKLFRNDMIFQRVFSKPFTVRWSFDVEMLTRFKVLRDRYSMPALEYSALELPLRKWEHKSGSKVKGIDFIIGLYELFKVFNLLRIPFLRVRYVQALLT